jgi:hypothetical protein
LSREAAEAKVGMIPAKRNNTVNKEIQRLIIVSFTRLS